MEVRAGKHELKDKYQIRRFADFEAGIGDVIVNALQEVRYVDDWQLDSNVTRQAIHPLWQAAQEVANRDLLEMRSGLLPGQIREIECEEAVANSARLILGNAIGYAVASGLSDDEIKTALPDLVKASIEAALSDPSQPTSKKIQRARERLRFLTPSG